MSTAIGDARARKSHSALVRAFNGLVLANGYAELTPAKIAETAGIARSTFYEHFSSKEALLRQSMLPLLQVLANSVRDTPTTNLERTIEHFWDNRSLARSLLTGRSRQVLADELSALIEKVLSDCRSPPRTNFPPWLSAVQIAHSQLALLDEWLTGRHGCRSADVAERLQTASRALARSLG